MPAETQSVVAMPRTSQPRCQSQSMPSPMYTSTGPASSRKSTQYRHCFSGFISRRSGFPARLSRPFRLKARPTSYPRNLAWNRVSHASTTDRTAPSTSSPVSVRSGCRKTMLKWTLCLSAGRVPPSKVSR